MAPNIIITGTGSYVPENIIANDFFEKRSFYGPEGNLLSESPRVIAEKLRNITGISERRYIGDQQQMHEIAAIAASRTIEDSGIDPETLDSIILAQNFGTIRSGTAQTDILPSIASRVKHELKIKNPACVAFDIVFGCPGWLQGVIAARQQILAGEAKKIMVIGAETLSRVLDPHDRDSMIYSDGAAAVILETVSDDPEKKGIISVLSRSYTYDEAYYLYMGPSNKKSEEQSTLYLKMNGKKIYEFALRYVPAAMKACLDKAGVEIGALKKIFIHQANEKMDEAILKSFYQLYSITTPPVGIMPMNIHTLGNSSVATIPTLLDMVLKNEQPGHKLEKGDTILMASVGAGMNVNAITYVMG
jgi:3-oxoacyl-[acyl-carrier-protein] synthase-3